MALFTHSYYRKGGAELNPVTDYFEDAVIVKAVIVKATKPGNGSGVTEEYREYRRKMYTFCQWVNVHKDLILLVKPCKPMRDEIRSRFGYPTSAVVVNKCFNNTEIGRVVWKSGGLASMDAIAGDVSLKEFSRFVTDKLRERGSEHIELWLDSVIGVAGERL